MGIYIPSLKELKRMFIRPGDYPTEVAQDKIGLPKETMQHIREKAEGICDAAIAASTPLGEHRDWVRLNLLMASLPYCSERREIEQLCEVLLMRANREVFNTRLLRFDLGMDPYEGEEEAEGQLVKAQAVSIRSQGQIVNSSYSTSLGSLSGLYNTQAKNPDY